MCWCKKLRSNSLWKNGCIQEKALMGEHRAPKRSDGVREGDGKNKAGKDGEQGEGGNVILRFILEQLLPHLSDGYQLCWGRETQGSKGGGGGRQIEGRLVVYTYGEIQSLQREEDDRRCKNRATGGISHTAKSTSRSLRVVAGETAQQQYIKLSCLFIGQCNSADKSPILAKAVWKIAWECSWEGE